MDINEAWKSTCKIIFGEEIGDLERYRNYLTLHIETVSHGSSVLSGKPVTLSGNEICASAKFISNDELVKYKSRTESTVLDINDTKDMDSLLGALAEKFYYAGNIVLGNSHEVHNSNRCIDATEVYESRDVYEGSRYIAFSDNIRKCGHCFGVTLTGESQFMIKAYGSLKNTRCMEVLRTHNSSDCYYAANLQGCSNCMFSFNLRNKSYAIGNLELPKEKYSELKRKLLQEIKETLKSKKSVPSVVSIIKEGQSKPADRKSAHVNETTAVPAEVESAFATVTRLLLGKKLGPLQAYKKWLTKYGPTVVKSVSPTSGKTVYVAPLPAFLEIKGNSVTLEESLELGKQHVSEAELKELNLSNAARLLKDIKHTTSEVVTGNCADISQCANYGLNSAHAFASSFVFAMKYVAYSYRPRNSEYVFGGSDVFYSNCCLNCHHSTNLIRCFEVSDSNNCSDCYFCHNSEGLSNCIFCFNAKSLRYAIGNKEVGREQYTKVKKLVLDEMIKTLERDKTLDYDIYNIGCYKPKKRPANAQPK
ncbi:MAG: hypothetical protein WC488_03065 [Candidatus Micrarchaeia archaeon]